MEQHLQEFVDSQGQQLRVDGERGVLRGVKLLGLSSRNGRTYRETALAEAAALYEGAKVNVNHPKGSPHTPRDYQDRLGAIRDVEFRQGEGLFGNLHYNPKHPLAEQLAWDAEHAPAQVGLSHNVLARTSREGQATVVEAITRVESVDLVADPATTRGLFEQQEQREPIRERFEAVLERVGVLERKLHIYELLAEYGLPLPTAPNAGRLVSEAFVDSLLAAPMGADLEALVSDRAALAKAANQPLQQVESREQQWLGESTHHAPATAKEFATAVRR